MASTADILDAARKLGELISTHDAAAKFANAMQQLRDDLHAQRALNDFNRFLTKLAEKEQSGQPIEVSDKRQLEQLQDAVVRHPLLSKMQIAQMDYLDLLRRVDAAMLEHAPDAMSGPLDAER